MTLSLSAIVYCFVSVVFRICFGEIGHTLVTNINFFVNQHGKLFDSWIWKLSAFFIIRYKKSCSRLDTICYIFLVIQIFFTLCIFHDDWTVHSNKKDENKLPPKCSQFELRCMSEINEGKINAHVEIKLWVWKLVSVLDGYAYLRSRYNL